MPDITFIHPDGSAQGLEAPLGVSVMQVAGGAGIGGILAECGGSANCATCHVIVSPEWAGRLPAPSPAELEMLACTAVERQPGSRLACQIAVTSEIDGLVVHLPERQQ